jgi:hypothetical protein
VLRSDTRVHTVLADSHAQFDVTEVVAVHRESHLSIVTKAPHEAALEVSIERLLQPCGRRARHTRIIRSRLRRRLGTT